MRVFKSNWSRWELCELSLGSSLWELLFLPSWKIFLFDSMSSLNFLLSTSSDLFWIDTEAADFLYFWLGGVDSVLSVCSFSSLIVGTIKLFLLWIFSDSHSYFSLLDSWPTSIENFLRSLLESFLIVCLLFFLSGTFKSSCWETTELFWLLVSSIGGLLI